MQFLGFIGVIVLVVVSALIWTDRAQKRIDEIQAETLKKGIWEENQFAKDDMIFEEVERSYGAPW